MKNLMMVSVLMMALAGCSVAAVEQVDLDKSVAADGKVVNLSVASRLADGAWISSSHVEGYQRIWVDNFSVWIDAKVKNLAYNKVMGVIWTDNNWQSNHVSYGTYKGQLADGYEKWGLDLGSWDERYYSGIKYCIFVEMNGVTYYDNNGGQNYTISF